MTLNFCLYTYVDVLITLLGVYYVSICASKPLLSFFCKKINHWIPPASKLLQRVAADYVEHPRHAMLLIILAEEGHALQHRIPNVSRGCSAAGLGQTSPQKTLSRELRMKALWLRMSASHEYPRSWSCCTRIWQGDRPPNEASTWRNPRTSSNQKVRGRRKSTYCKNSDITRQKSG